MKEYTATEGKVYRSKIDGAYLSNILILGINDSVDNYEEVDPPIYDEGEEDV